MQRTMTRSVDLYYVPSTPKRSTGTISTCSAFVVQTEAEVGHMNGGGRWRTVADEMREILRVTVDTAGAG